MEIKSKEITLVDIDELVENPKTWKKLPNTIYSISSCGSIGNDIRNYIKKQTVTKDGYLTACIQGKTMQSHRLVARLFNENFSDNLVVNHIDFNRKNNDYRNLQMCTVKENVRHSSRVGRYTRKGELNNNCKYKNETVLMIRTYLETGLNCVEISKITNINRRYINGIKLGNR